MPRVTLMTLILFAWNAGPVGKIAYARKSQLTHDKSRTYD